VVDILIAVVLLVLLPFFAVFIGIVAIVEHWQDVHVARAKQM
jgi:hypothetical protein